MLRTLVLVAFLIAWFAMPLVLGLTRGMVHNRWMLQETSREYGYMVGVAIAWLIPILVTYLWVTWGDSAWRDIAVLVAWSVLTGMLGGQLFLNLTNHDSAALGHPVEFKCVGHERVTVRVRAVGEAYDRITFQRGVVRWSEQHRAPTGNVPGMIYRGRLGLLWGEFRDK
jgi:hypothetical protein